MAIIDWNNDSVSAQGSKSGGDKPKINKFRGSKDKMDRIFLIDKTVIAVRRHYYYTTYMRCLKDVGAANCPICDRVWPKYKAEGKNSMHRIALPKLTFSTNVLLYETDKTGSPTSNPPKFSIAMWSFDAQKYDNIRALAKIQGSLDNIDLFVACADEQFQKLSFMPGRECLVKTSQALWDSACGMFNKNKYDVEKFLCRTMNAADIVAAMDKIDSEYSSGKFTKDKSFSAPGQQTAFSATADSNKNTMVAETKTPPPIVNNVPLTGNTTPASTTVSGLGTNYSEKPVDLNPPAKKTDFKSLLDNL